MNKPQLENHNLFWDHIGESRHIPPAIYDGIYYALGALHLCLSYQMIPFPLSLLPRFQFGSGWFLVLKRSWEHW